MFEVGSVLTFRAFHRMPGHPPPENERHGHDYRVEVVAERRELDGRGMVCDLDLLKMSLEAAAERLRDQDLAEVCGAEGITVELLASWLLDQLAPALGADGAESVHVRVWESDEAFGGTSVEIV
jgi:6-pyruvoyltetrahydropterin/6-carboxytetrahydropterin synthase